MINPGDPGKQTTLGRRRNPDALAIAAQALTLLLFYWGFWVGRAHMSDDTLTEFYPGWVTDNSCLKLIEVFGAFQGLVIPEAGRGRVVVRFLPPTLWRSLALSVFSLVMVRVGLSFGEWDKGSEVDAVT